MSGTPMITYENVDEFVKAGVVREQMLDDGKKVLCTTVAQTYVGRQRIEIRQYVERNDETKQLDILESVPFRATTMVDGTVVYTQPSKKEFNLLQRAIAKAQQKDITIQ